MYLAGQYAGLLRLLRIQESHALWATMWRHGHATSESRICQQVGRGHAELIININASPFHKGKGAIRERMLSQRARENGVIVSYTNMVGGQDEIVFDGNSLLVDRRGRIMARAKSFEEDLLIADLEFESSTLRRRAQKSQVSSRLVSRYSLKKVVGNRALKPKEKKSIQSVIISKIEN